MADNEDTKLYDQVVALLSPHLGGTTASASVKLYLNKMALTPETLGPHHLESLADQMKPGMVVFVGAEQAQILADQIKKLGLGVLPV